MSQPWTKQPNRQKALETTIPALCSILFALISGIFVAAAMSDSKLLDANIRVCPYIINSVHCFNVIVERRAAIFFASMLSGIFFYKSLLHCVWSQMSHFDETSSNPDVGPVQSSDAVEILDWALIRKRWNDRRIKHASLSLLYFDIGMNLLPLSMMFLLPPGLLALGFYVWLVSLYSFVQALNRSQYFRKFFNLVR